MDIQKAWAFLRRFLFWAVPAALIVALVWTFLPHGGPPPHPSAQAPATTPEAGAGSRAGSEPLVEVHEGDVVWTDSEGGKRWRIVADDVTVVQNMRVVVLRNVRAVFTEKDGSTITITGKTGQYDTRTQEVEINGSVHGVSSIGRELYADRLRWVPRSGILTGTGHIRLLLEHTTMYADRMVSNTTLGRTQFFGHVHASAQ